MMFIKKILYLISFLLFPLYLIGISDLTTPDGFSSYFSYMEYKKYLKKQKKKEAILKKNKEVEFSMKRNRELKKRQKERKEQQIIETSDLKKKLTSDMIQETLENFQKKEKLSTKKEELDSFHMDHLSQNLNKNDKFVKEKKKEDTIDYQKLLNQFKINGVIVFKDNKKAIINNQIYSIGDYLNESIRLVDVHNEYISIMEKEKIIKLELPRLNIRKQHFKEGDVLSNKDKKEKHQNNPQAYVPF